MENLLNKFYAVATRDEEIGHHFAELDLAAHLPITINFREKILFSAPVYFGSPLAVHRILHAKSPLATEHFQKWFEIFSCTVDELFAGKTADFFRFRTIGSRQIGAFRFRLLAAA